MNELSVILSYVVAYGFIVGYLVKLVRRDRNLARRLGEQ